MLAGVIIKPETWCWITNNMKLWRESLKILVQYPTALRKLSTIWFVLTTCWLVARSILVCINQFGRTYSKLYDLIFFSKRYNFYFLGTCWILLEWNSWCGSCALTIFKYFRRESIIICLFFFLKEQGHFYSNDDYDPKSPGRIIDPTNARPALLPIIPPAKIVPTSSISKNNS